jgi:hypothetical protein
VEAKFLPAFIDSAASAKLNHLFILGLFNGTIMSSDYKMSNGGMLSA